VTTTTEARKLQAKLVQLLSRGTKAERQALLDAARCVARGSRNRDLALACRGALEAVAR